MHKMSTMAHMPALVTQPTPMAVTRNGLLAVQVSTFDMDTLRRHHAR